tara:strand:- start:448 stop:666 length:219 start_codon:yes stop_codon:yes gene_type:complete
MPKYSITVRTELTRLWIIKASDMSDMGEAERMAKKATHQLIQYEEILDGCEVESTSERDYPTVERVEVWDEK